MAESLETGASYLELSDRYGLALAFSHAATYTEVELTLPPASYTV